MIDTIEVTSPSTPEKVTPIKPSEAIRLGRLIRPVQVKGAFWAGRDGACTLGAVATGLGFASGAFSLDALGSLNDIGIYIYLHSYYSEFPQLYEYIRNIPFNFDCSIKTEEQIISELEEQGW